MLSISVFPQDNEQKTTRYPKVWQELPVVTPLLTLTVSGNTITVGGTPSSPLNAAAIVNRVGYVYPVQPSDTLTSIATGLASIINANMAATSLGAVITIHDVIPQASGPMELTVNAQPLSTRFGGAIEQSMSGHWPSRPAPQPGLTTSGSWKKRFGGSLLESMAYYWPSVATNLRLSGPWRGRFGGAILESMAEYFPTPSVGICARVGAVGTVIREIKRQKRGFQITFWCPTPALRDAIVPPCDVMLANIDFLTLPDGTAGRLLYERSHVSDRAEREGLYRRDLFYSVEYGTTQTQSAAEIVTELFNIRGGLDPSAPVIETFSR